MGINSCVGTEGDFYAAREGVLDILASNSYDLAHLVCIHRRQTDRLSVLQHPGLQVHRRHQICAVLLHSIDSSIVYIGTVFDGIDARFRRPQDALGSMSVGSDLASEPMSVRDNGFHLLQREL